MPLLGPDMETRNQAFQKLKPACVELSQAALALNGPRANTKAVTKSLEDVKQILSSITAKRDVLDEKLADYAFFPISNVLKLSQKIPIRCLELSFECISILVEHGWQRRIQPQLAAQVVILCTLMAEKKPKGFAFDETTDELQVAAFSCLYHVFTSMGYSKEAKDLMTSDAHFPQLGQSISVILDGINDGDSIAVQGAATNALESLIKNVANREVCAGFLPGIVSKLTKILTPSTQQRRNHQVLAGCVGVLETLLQRTMDDESDPQSDSQETIKTESENAKSKPSIIDAKWREGASSRLEPALISILRLKTHDREDVRGSTAALCFTLLQHCRKSLANCSKLALETLLTVIAAQPESEVHLRLENILMSDASLLALLQESLYDWLQSLPTTMQSADEHAKAQKLMQINSAYGLLAQSGTDTSTIDRLLANTLRDSVVVTLQAPITKQKPSGISPVQSTDIAVLDQDLKNSQFSSALVRQRGQEEVMNKIEDFTKYIGNSSTSSTFATYLGRSLRLSQGEPQIAGFWLMLTSVQTALDRKGSMDDFLNIENEDMAIYQEHLEELYSFSLSILTDSTDEPPDTRLQGLALRTLALRAQTAGEDFRYELIDALYPVLHTLATPDDQLQQDSIVTLNIFTSACGYGSVKDLIVENVDYLTNAVALKLNSFDVSPQAPQVLLMMVRLAGSGLLPYLEDTVESIFAALEDYHGYSLLVELLFKVLHVMAEEAVKEPQLAITAGKSSDSNRILQETYKPLTINDLVEFLEERVVQESNLKDEASVKTEAHPEKPWKGIEEVDDENPENEGEDNADQNEPIQEVEIPPPAPKVYNLLFKITELTQHFLPSASPSLRASLLALIQKSVPALSRHENSFLPLINTLWPEITARLDDDEPHVQATALEIIAVLCQYAGDFMRSRIAELWPGLVEVHDKTVAEIVAANRPASAPAQQSRKPSSQSLVQKDVQIKQLVKRMQDSPASYSNTSARLTWEALVTLLTTIVQHVRISQELFDGALQMLGPVMDQEEVQAAFKGRNGDAVWLARLRSGANTLPPVPIVPDGAEWQFATLRS